MSQTFVPSSRWWLLGPKGSSFRANTGVETLISFNGAHYPKDVILYAVYLSVRFGVSYRDLAEIMAERGIAVDNITLDRWVKKFASVIADEAHRRKAPAGQSWRMPFRVTNETYIKVRGKRTYLYRAIGNNGWPDKVVIDKSGSNAAGLFNMNCLLVMLGWCRLIDVLQIKYLNNVIEQPFRHLLRKVCRVVDHRFAKKLTRPTQTFKSFN